MLRRACANSVWDSKHPVSREPALSASSSARSILFFALWAALIVLLSDVAAAVHVTKV